jgi:AraC-like DNA-binding protein
MLETAVNFINEHLSESLSVDYISKETHISKSSLYNIFHIHYGVTISEYVNKARIEHSKELMMNSDLSMENIAYASGFSSLAYFSRVFKAEEKISPTKYKQNLKKRHSEKS